MLLVTLELTSRNDLIEPLQLNIAGVHQLGSGQL